MAITPKILSGFAILAAAQSVTAHTWVEMIRRISSAGTYIGEGGYAMGHVNRTDPGFDDTAVMIRIDSTNSKTPMCGSFTGYNNADYPPLTAAPGEFLALQYRENGHVSFPNLTPRGFRSGNVMIYGTSESIVDGDIGINDVLYQWNADGTSGNQKGKLLASHFFDDGQCYEPWKQEPSSTRDERIEKYNLKELMCQSIVQLPSEIEAPNNYSLIWVWDWPLRPNEAGASTEIYVSCININLDDSLNDVPTSVEAFSFEEEPDVSNAAIPSQIATLIEVEQRGTGTASPPAPTGFPEATSLSSTSASSNAAASNSHVSVGWATVMGYACSILLFNQLF